PDVARESLPFRLAQAFPEPGADAVGRRAVDQHEVRVVEPELREIRPGRSVGVVGLFHLRDEVEGVACHRGPAHGFPDTRLRAVIARRVDHRVAELERPGYRAGGVVRELPGAEAEHRHAVPGVEGQGRLQVHGRSSAREKTLESSKFRATPGASLRRRAGKAYTRV